MPGAARYFPVTDAPLKMAAGLTRHGSDFGQGHWDRSFFQLDEHYERYLAEKRAAPSARHALSGTDAAAAAARDAGLAWLRATLAHEAPFALARADADQDARDPFEALARAVQEDLAILLADNETDRLVAVDIRFPSGFRPEAIVGKSFHATHRAVPGFADDLLAARSMVQSMTQRGPYVRFVWALCTDDTLDHHPEVYAAVDWEQAQQAFLRVERQTTVPLREANASLFLIRTHIYALSALTHEQRETLSRAIANAPDTVRAYKRLPNSQQLARILARI